MRNSLTQAAPGSRIRSWGRKLASSSAMIGALALAAPTPSQAELLAYEDFSSYAIAGNMNGVYGGEGTGIEFWTAQHASLTTVMPPTLDYGMPTGANKLATGYGGTTIRAKLDLTPEGPFADYIDSLGYIGKTGTTLYVSMLIQVTPQTAGGELLTGGTVQADWKFRRDAANSNWGFGQAWQGAIIQTTNGNYPLVSPLDSDVHLVILKIEYKDGSDTVTFWMDPLLGAEESAYQVAATLSTNASFDMLDFKGQGNRYFVDEIRFGTTFDSVTADARLQPPATPIGFSASAVSDTEVALLWGDVSLNEEGFKVERATSTDGPWTEVADLGVDTIQHIDSGLTASTEYFYRVFGYNANGNGNPAGPFAVTTFAEGVSVPAQPTNFAGSANDFVVGLSWNDNADNEIGYRIYRSIGSGTFQLLAEVGKDVSSFPDQNIPANQTIRYRVVGFNENGESISSEIITIDPLSEPSSGTNWVWKEAENFDSTTFRGNGSSWLSPSASEKPAVSNEGMFTFLANEDEKNSGFMFDYYTDYTIEIPQDGEYLVYLRRLWSYGVFKWRMDDGDWQYVGDAPKLDEVPYRQFFPLSWAEMGSVYLTAGTHTLRMSANPGVDFPLASGGDASNYGWDAFLFTQVPFSPAGKNKPGVKFATADDGKWAFEPSAEAYGESPIDLSYLNEDVAGQDGWVTRQGDELFLGNGEKVRFLGTTISNGTYSSYLAQAKFLSKHGMNIVRWHSSIDDRSGDAETASSVSENRIESVQQCVAAMKEEGIYTNLSIFFILGHRIQENWGIEGYDLAYVLNNDRAPFGIFFFNDKMKAAYKDWINELLTRPNPWEANQTPLGQDPAVAMFEILNEDNVFFFTFNPSQYPEAQRKLLYKTFGDFLVEKYGSIDDAYTAWGGGSRTADDVEAGEMEVVPPSGLRYTNTSTGKRMSDQAEFMMKIQSDFWNEIEAYVKELGFGGLIIPTNWKTANDRILRDLEYKTYAETDMIDVHNYFGTPNELAGASYTISVGDKYRNVSAIDRPSDISVALKQVEGIATSISEFTWVNPTDLSLEGPMITAAYSALQDIDAVFWFAYGGVGFDKLLDKWMTGRPSIMGQFPGTALMYRRGDVSMGPTAVREGRSMESMLKMENSLIVQGSGFDPTRDTGWDPSSGAGKVGMEAALAGRVELGFGEDWDYTHPDLDAHLDYDNGIFRSLTGELEINQPEGLFKVETPSSQGATGYMGAAGEVDFADCTIVMDNDFGAVLVISLDGRPIAESGEVLIQAMTMDDPYGYSVTPASVNGVEGGWQIANLGNIPFNVEIISGEVLLKGFAGASAQFLDENGYPVSVPVTFDEGDDLRVKLPFSALYTVVSREVDAGAPTLLSKAVPSPVIDKPYSAKLQALGGDNLTWSVSSGTLPTGLSLAADGTLSGTVTETGVFNVTVQVQGDSGSRTGELPIYVVSEYEPVVEPGWTLHDALGWVYVYDATWAYSPMMGMIYSALMENGYVYQPKVGWCYMASGAAGSGLWIYSFNASYGWIYAVDTNGGWFQAQGLSWDWDSFTGE